MSWRDFASGKLFLELRPFVLRHRLAMLFELVHLLFKVAKQLLSGCFSRLRPPAAGRAAAPHGIVAAATVGGSRVEREPPIRGQTLVNGHLFVVPRPQLEIGLAGGYGRGGGHNRQRCGLRPDLRVHSLHPKEPQEPSLVCNVNVVEDRDFGSHIQRGVPGFLARHRD